MAHVLNTLKTAAPPAPLRWSAVEGLHLTLHFLGEIAPPVVQALAGALPAVVSACPPFAVTFERLGCFPHSRRPTVFWLGVSDPSGGLLGVHAALSAMREDLGFPEAEHAFTPHLTLARVPRASAPPRDQSLTTWFEAQTPPVPYTMSVTMVHLMHSELRPTGSRYTSVLVCSLGCA